MRLARREQDLATKGARFIALGCSLLSWAWSIYLARGGIRMKRCALIFTTIVFGSFVAGAAVAQQKAQAKLSAEAARGKYWCRSRVATTVTHPATRPPVARSKRSCGSPATSLAGGARGARLIPPICACA